MVISNWIRGCFLLRRQSMSSSIIRVLNVAEKHDAAKNIANLLSKGSYQQSHGIYSFDQMVQGRKCHMRMTAVSGHLLEYDFPKQYRKWYSCPPIQLFDLPLIKVCEKDRNIPIKRNLEREAKQCQWLIIWTDCDREGENIGFEIREVCLAVAPRIRVFRAKFSEITRPSVEKALRTLTEPDEKVSNAVDVRQQLDLRIGAAFTRLQTLRLVKRYPSLANHIISYGSCQFPTMGFVVERYKAIEAFIPEAFWKIKVTHEYENTKVEFNWKRVRLFNKVAAEVYHDICTENPVAKVESCQCKPKSKWRPLPLETVELEKLSSRKLRMSAKKTMQIAEKLYTSGFISYPRTETNIYPKDLNLQNFVELQTQSPQWGNYASNLLSEGLTPRQGKKSDQAHPPIYPTKFTNSLKGDEAKLYEFVVRHFLASVSKDAVGKETTVNIDINGEKFIGHGLSIIERNYLEVYPYERWTDKEILNYEAIEEFEPSSIELVDGSTSPPNLLTEADLIALMDKHGIGTDATHAEHIETIKSRGYVGLQDSRFVPGQLGIALCDGYDAMGFEMSKPHLRSALEADLKAICDGRKDPQVVLQEQINNYKEVFVIAMQQAKKIDEACTKYLNESPREEADEGFSSMNTDRFTPTLSTTIKCNCAQFASEKTVVKEGPNKGRKFYCCSKPRDDESRCDFFQWCDEPTTSPSTQSNSSTESSITCNCGKVATSRTTQKEGPNKGRVFFSCPLSFTDKNRCDFFKWADDISNNTQSSTYPSASSNHMDENSLTCGCGTMAIKKTVTKEGPNRGKEFWACPKPYGSSDNCKFFQWADETSSQASRGNFNGQDVNSRETFRGGNRGPFRGGGGGGSSGLKRTGSTSRPDSGEKKKRRCGICHEEGHTRNRCPSSSK